MLKASLYFWYSLESPGISGSASLVYVGRPVTTVGRNVIWKLIAPLDLQALMNVAVFTREVWGLLGVIWLFDGQSSLG